MIADLPKSGVVIWAAWRDTLTSLTKLFRLVIIVFLIASSFELAKTSMTFEGLTSKFIGELIDFCALIFVPYEIAVYRLVLLGEVSSGYFSSLRTRRLRRFFAWSAAISAAFSLMLFPFSLDVSLWQAALLLFLVGVVVCVLVRLILIFPAIAIDAQGASAANAWADSKGHFWFISRSGLLSLFPAILASALMVAAAGGGFVDDVTNVSFGGKIIRAVGAGALEVITLTAGAAVMARAFQWIGNRLK